MKRLVLILSVLFLISCSSGNENNENIDETLFGHWSGDIEIPSSPLPIIVELDRTSAKLSVPAQGLENYPATSVDYEDNNVTIKIDLAGSKIIISGLLKDDKITGTFSQDNQSFPIELLSYVAEEKTYEEIKLPIADGELTAALQLPESDGPHDLAIIIAGSGPTDKNGNSIGFGENNSLKMLAEQLASEGIASIRYDKRGVGDNALLIENEEDLSIEDYVTDVKDIINYVQADENYKSIHILGHSEGALIGGLATKDNAVHSYVSLAGPGRPIDVVLMEQLESQLNDELIEEAKQILENLAVNKQVDSMSEDLMTLFRPSVQPFMMSLMKYDPAEVISGITVPTLIIQGTFDLQITLEDAERLKKHNEMAKLVVIKEMNHILKTTTNNKEENLATYTDPTIPLNNEMVTELIKFLKDN